MGVLSQFHDEAQKHIKDRFENAGFEVLEFVYHNLNSSELITQFQKCNLPECLFVRSLPDLLVYKSDKCMFIEIKSKSPKYDNLAIELFPFMVNYHLENMGLNILYMYTENEDGKTKIYYLKTKEIVNLISRVFITNKFPEQINTILRDFSETILNISPTEKPIGEICQRKNELENVGSGDPFVIIPKDKLSEFKELKENEF